MHTVKTEREILEKLRIKKLNPMQLEARETISQFNEVLLLSPTGTGKTLAFLLPLIQGLDPKLKKVQVLIVVPSRELAIQIEQVVREMGTGIKANAFYGGRAGTKDKIDLNHPPAILIGTPGRLASHFYRETFDVSELKTIVLDEFDKSLEIGFDDEMIEILEALPQVEKKVLTSATFGVEIPEFVEFSDPVTVNYLSEEKANLTIHALSCGDRSKSDGLTDLLARIGHEPGIVFCNFKDSIATVSQTLTSKGIEHTSFHGGMEQRDRERALIQFRNGSKRLLLATDLAARGIDIPDLKFIIHYELPHGHAALTHRNGRTARMHKEGAAYLIKGKNENWPDFVNETENDFSDFIQTKELSPTIDKTWKTLFISGGRKDKISKGDIAGLLFKQGKLDRDDVGIIELKTDCAFVAVNAEKAEAVIPKITNTRLKKKKVRISMI